MNDVTPPKAEPIAHDWPFISEMVEARTRLAEQNMGRRK